MDVLLSGIVQEDGERPSPAPQGTRMWFSKSMAGQVLEDWIQEGQKPTGVQISSIPGGCPGMGTHLGTPKSVLDIFVSPTQ